MIKLLLTLLFFLIIYMNIRIFPFVTPQLKVLGVLVMIIAFLLLVLLLLLLRTWALLIPVLLAAVVFLIYKSSI